MPSSKPFVDPETLAAVTTAAAANEAAKAEDALKVQRVRCWPRSWHCLRTPQHGLIWCNFLNIERCRSCRSCCPSRCMQPQVSQTLCCTDTKVGYARSRQQGRKCSEQWRCKAWAHVSCPAAQAGSVGATRKDAALAALSSQLAGLQLQAGAGQGRRASMPEARGGVAGGQADPAVVQVRRVMQNTFCHRPLASMSHANSLAQDVRRRRGYKLPATILTQRRHQPALSANTDTTLRATGSPEICVVLRSILTPLTAARLRTQVLQALLRQAAVQQQQQGQALPASQHGLGGDALLRATAANHPAAVASMPMVRLAELTGRQHYEQPSAGDIACSKH